MTTASIRPSLSSPIAPAGIRMAIDRFTWRFRTASGNVAVTRSGRRWGRFRWIIRKRPRVCRSPAEAMQLSIWGCSDNGLRTAMNGSAFIRASHDMRRRPTRSAVTMCPSRSARNSRVANSARAKDGCCATNRSASLSMCRPAAFLWRTLPLRGAKSLKLKA